MRTAIYARISDDRTGNGAGVERQEAECRSLADRLGWEVVAVCSDASISAFGGGRRPGFTQLQDLIRAGKVDAVVAWAADRITRHPRELEDLVDLLDETGTKVQTVTSGEYDLGTADGRATARIHGAIARQESEKKSERIRSQKAQSAAKGERPGGPRAYGWTPGRREIIPDEIEIVREMATRVIAGEGIATITRDLNARGLRTTRGNEWDRHTVRQLLTNPATAGLRRQPDGGTVEGDWQGAYSKDTWNRLCAILSDPARKTTHRLRNYLLTGLVYDTEGRRLITRGGEKRMYRTPPGSGGNGVAISVDKLEAEIVEAVLRVTDNLELHEPEVESPDVDSIEAQLAELAELWGKGQLTAAEWNSARGPLQARLAEARQRERRTPRVSEMDWGRPGLLRESWDRLTIQQQRQAIEMFIEKIEVAPSGSQARVRVTWRA